MPKRKCRMNPLEKRNHDEAVKLRKMTDQQISESIHNIVTEAFEAGYKKGFKESKQKPEGIKEFLENITIPGVGKTTVDKLMIFAKERGYIGVGGV